MKVASRQILENGARPVQSQTGWKYFPCNTTQHAAFSLHFVFVTHLNHAGSSSSSCSCSSSCAFCSFSLSFLFCRGWPPHLLSNKSNKAFLETQDTHLNFSQAKHHFPQSFVGAFTLSLRRNTPWDGCCCPFPKRGHALYILLRGIVSVCALCLCFHCIA